MFISYNTQSVVVVPWRGGQQCDRRNKQNRWIICRTVVNLQYMYIVPLHQTTANLHPAVEGLSHLVTIDVTRRLASSLRE